MTCLRLRASGGAKPLARAAKRSSCSRRPPLLAVGVAVGAGARQHRRCRRLGGRTAQTLDKLIWTERRMTQLERLRCSYVCPRRFLSAPGGDCGRLISLTTPTIRRAAIWIGSSRGQGVNNDRCSSSSSTTGVIGAAREFEVLRVGAISSVRAMRHRGVLNEAAPTPFRRFDHELNKNQHTNGYIVFFAFAVAEVGADDISSVLPSFQPLFFRQAFSGGLKSVMI